MDIIMHLLLKNAKKTHIFWMKFHPKIFNFEIVLDLIDIYQYHKPLKIWPKNSIHNPSFDVYMQFFKLCDE
jgi:hypothetical protein